MLDRDHTLLVVVDVQERMMPVIHRGAEIIREVARLVKGCRALGLPILVTEQYPQGLGATVPEVREALGEWYRPVEKLTFSAEGNLRFMSQLEAAGKSKVLVCGVETHVCVYQTARDLRNFGHDVDVVADAVSSRREINHTIALQRLTRHSVETTTVEMALFDMLESADAKEFKAISALVKPL